MTGIPKRYKGHTRGHLVFYGSSSSSWEDLVDALGRRGYEIECYKELNGVDKLPENLSFVRGSKIYEAVVIYLGNEMKRCGPWNPLINLSDANNWSVAHKNVDRVRKPERRRF